MSERTVAVIDDDADVRESLRALLESDGYTVRSYASAMAWVLVLIVGAFTALNFLASKWWVFYDD